MTTIRPGAYDVNGVHVHIYIGPDGKAILSRHDADTGGMRELEGAERARWLSALRLDEADR